VSCPERLTAALVHAATEAGAAAANHVEALGLLRQDARVVGVRARDVLTGEDLPVRARMVLNASGAGAREWLGGSGIRPPVEAFLQASNLVFDRRPPVSFAVGARSAGRFLFLVPWGDRTMVGTAYAPEGAPDATGAFRREAEAAFPWAGLEAARLVLVHEGLVPGDGGASGLATRPRLVDHEAADGVPGLVSVQGVKYTTARAVAERAVDRVAARLGRGAARPARPGPLSRARPLQGSLEARTREAVEEEMALTLADAVLRRLDLGTGGPPSAPDLDKVARTMRAALRWDASRESAERAALAKRYPAA
jgi:glycerol-3-phosphate dehydrogenase